MSQRWRDATVVTVIVAVLLLVFYGVLTHGRRRVGEQPPAAPAPGVAATAGRAPSSPGAKVAVPKATAAEGGSGATRSESASTPGAGANGETPAVSPAGAWSRRPPGDFVPEDLAQCGRGVWVDLGTCEAAAGSEFAVVLRLTAPALESCSLVVQYDPEALAVVPESARPEGPAFRGGIEAYAAPGGGKLVILHAGVPGKKNVEAAVAGPVVVWRMRALRAGVTHLVVLPESSFTSGRGLDEAYEVAGGEVNVR